MATIQRALAAEAVNFLQNTTCGLISQWSCASNRTTQEQERAVRQYYDLFTDGGKQLFNLKATPTSYPIQTLASWNRDAMLSIGRFGKYSKYQLVNPKVINADGDQLHVKSLLRATIEGRTFTSPVIHVIQRADSNWKIVETRELEITPRHPVYGSVFCRWMFPHVGSVAHVGAALARFSTYFVKLGLSSALWKAQSKKDKNAEPLEKFGIIAQELLTAYLLGALPAEWEIMHNSREGRAEIDIKCVEPGSRTRIYYIESKANLKGTYSSSLTSAEKDQINRLRLQEHAEYHVVKFGADKHDVHLQSHRLPDGRRIKITVTI